MLSQTQPKKIRQQISYNDSSVVGGIACLPIGAKEALVAEGVLTRITGGYRLKTVIYRSFKKGVELFPVYRSNLILSSYTDWIGYDVKKGIEETPDTTIINEWRIIGYRATRTNQTVQKGGLPTIPNKGVVLEMADRNNELKKIKDKKPKPEQLPEDERVK